MSEVEGWQLKQRQSLKLEVKTERSKLRIKEYFDYYDGEVYIAFSGGKDSWVLLHLIRELCGYDDVRGNFCDTGLEFPKIRSFVKTIPKIDWTKPDKLFPKVIADDGFPIISKNVAMAFDRYRKTKDPVQKRLRLYGGINPNTGKEQKTGVIPKKYHYLLKAPFDISELCCYWLKKKPAYQYGRKTGKKPFLGMMASDSNQRQRGYLKTGCNSFEGLIQSNPLGFWNEKDIWDYIKLYELEYSSIYDMGYDRTGCMFCMFGILKEPKPNRFQLMAETHPKQHDFCLNKLGCKVPLEWLKVDYNSVKGLESFDEH